MSTAQSETPTLAHIPIDPRIRRRVVEVRRAEGRRRLHILVAVAAAIALVAAALGLLESPLAAVRHARISGAGVLGDRAVLAAAGLDRHPLMVDVHPGAVVRSLDAIPVVDTARVTREWPSTVRILLTLRRPVAAINGPGGRAIVDGTGRILATGAGAGAGLPSLAAPGTPGSPAAWLPGSWSPGSWLPGLKRSGSTLAGSATGGPASSSAVAGVGALGAVGAELALASAVAGWGMPAADAVLSVGVDPSEGLVATIGSTTVVLGDASALAAKGAALVALATHGVLPGAAKVDLRVPDRPAVVPIGARPRP